MITKKNYKNVIIFIFLCLLFLFNAILIKPVQINLSTTAVTAEQTVNTNEIPETVFKINNLDSSLIDEQEKHESVYSNTNTEIENDITAEDMIEFYILSMIYNSIAYDLSSQGLEVFEANALDVDNEIIYFGLCFTNNEVIMDNYISAGFVTIVSSTESQLNKNLNLVAFNNGEDDGYKYLISDFGQETSDDHFVIYNKYVKYEWKNSLTVQYTISENDKNYYDESLGLLYSYDESKYIYDNDFTYTALEVSMMFTEINFDELQKTIDEINAEQAKNGYYVQEITITYISSELIEEWERCSDKNTLYGYDLDELNEEFGSSTTLEFTSDGGIKQATLIEEKKPTNWLKAGLMFLGGCAAILIGAAIAPLTGGCSFVASALCIAKMTAIAVVTDLLVKTVVSTITNVVNGQGFWDALSSSIKSTFTVENIAQSFMTSAIMSAVMVGSGLVKACFVEGTPVLTGNGYRNIETLSVGDKVLSYSELTGAIALKEITETMVNTSNDICTIALDSGETITSTSLHPWYVQGKGWTPAYALTSADELLTESGEEVRILGVNRQTLDKPINVYNISVDKIDSEDYHTYYVGSDSVLVHNTCSTKTTKTDTSSQPTKAQIKNARQSAVRKAWKNEQNAVMNNTSKYNWTASQKQELLKYGKVKGYQGCHLIDVSKSGGNLSLIGNPDNIVFLQKTEHLFIHGGSWQNVTDISKVKDLLPWVVEQLSKLGL